MRNNAKIIPVILCGGAGSRLWPVSSETLPKQFLKLTGDKSLLQETALRASRMGRVNPNDILCVTHKTQHETVSAHLTAALPDNKIQIIAEPLSKNTAAAIANAVIYAAARYAPDDILVIMPSDGYVENTCTLNASIDVACTTARSGKILLIGIKPYSVETGYGYIRMGLPMTPSVLCVSEFLEKPSLEKAEAYIQSNEYLWNSGIFVTQISTLLEEFEYHAPEILHAVQNNIDTYQDVAALSFDKAILEKSSNLAVTPCATKWSDIGTWEGLWHIWDTEQTGT